jgi:hypothetical protein
MTRRALFSLPATMLAQVHDTPYNRMALAANDFDRQYRAWAEQVNVNRGQALNAKSVDAWEPLPALFRRLEHLWMEWVRKV